MQITILGKSGFIGSNLVNLFESQGHDITALDRLELAYPKVVLKTFEASDVIINCIGSANVGFSYTNPNNDFESNVGVTQKFLQILRDHKLNHIKFINLSSAAVYGNPLKLPVNESDPKIPLSPYGFHKLTSEILIKGYSDCFDLKTLSLRIFSAYGNDQKKLLLWDLHQKIQNSDGKIVLFGTGNESRDFIHIVDIAQQILLAINHAEFVGEAINVANGVEVKILEVVELYQRYYPEQFDYEFNGEERLGDPLNWCADVSTMINWGYKQSVMIDQGIDNYIKHIFCD